MTDSCLDKWKKKIDLFGYEPDDKQKSYFGCCVTVFLGLGFFVYSLSELVSYARNANTPTISFGFEETAEEIGFYLNYTNFAITIFQTGSGAGSVSSNVDLFSSFTPKYFSSTFATSEYDQSSFQPINESSFVYGKDPFLTFYTFDRNVQLNKSADSALITFQIEDCTAPDFEICIYFPTYYQLNLTTGQFDNSSETWNICLESSTAQIMETTYAFQQEKYTRTATTLMFASFHPEERQRFVRPDYFVNTFSKPFTCSQSADIVLVNLGFDRYTGDTTIKYPQFNDFTSKVGGTWTFIFGILTWSAIALWWCCRTAGKVEVRDG